VAVGKSGGGHLIPWLVGQAPLNVDFTLLCVLQFSIHMLPPMLLH
jgi:hypothetical protein